MLPCVGVTGTQETRSFSRLRPWKESIGCTEATVPGCFLIGNTKEPMLRPGRSPCGAASNSRGGKSKARISWWKMEEQQCSCRAKLLPQSWTASSTPTPPPKRPLYVWSGCLLGDTNTNPSLWDVGCAAPKPFFFSFPYHSTLNDFRLL